MFYHHVYKRETGSGKVAKQYLVEHVVGSFMVYYLFLGQVSW